MGTEYVRESLCRELGIPADDQLPEGNWSYNSQTDVSVCEWVTPRGVTRYYPRWGGYWAFTPTHRVADAEADV